MAGTERARAALFVGGLKTGKTHAAIRWSASWSAKEPAPVLVVDSAAALNFARMRHARMRDLARILWIERRSVAWVPDDEQDVEPGEAVARVIRAVCVGKRVHVLVDESSFWIGAQAGARAGASGQIERLVRSARHFAATIAMTSQYPVDFSRAVLSCRPEAHVFRCDDQLGLERLASFYNGADVSRAPRLPPRERLILR